MQRKKCIGSAQLRGSDKKKNGVKIASERETNSLQSLRGPGKTVASRYHHHHHYRRPHGGYNHSRFFSSYPHRHLQKYHLQCLAEPVVSICLIWIEFSEHKNSSELSHLPKQIHHIFTEGNKSNAGPIPHSFEDRGCISARLINMQNIRALLATRIFPPLHTLQMCTNIITFCVFLKKLRLAKKYANLVQT